MLGAIKRVISGEDMRGGGEGEESNDNERILSTPEQSQSHPGIVNMSSDVAMEPVLVENDQDMDMELDVGVIESVHHGTPGSSLSDVSDGHASAMMEDVDNHLLQADPRQSQLPPPPPTTTSFQQQQPPPQAVTMQVATKTLPRNDSKVSNDSSSASNSMKGSSQNSSRDWGWFEDVHTSNEALASTPQKHLKKKKPPRMVPTMVPNPPSTPEPVLPLLNNGTLPVVSFECPRCVTISFWR